MSRIWAMMDVGKRSLANSQTGLQTVSHNIANKGTEGYSRQRVELKSNEPTGLGRLRIGQGARAAAVTRTNNSYLEKQIEKEGTNLGQLSGKSEALARVEQVFNEQNNKGLNKFMADFFNAFRDLSNSPESLATRTLVKETADYMAKDFKRIHNQLTEIQGDIDFQLLTHVEEVNGYTSEIARLNEKIQVVELTGAHANDERDRRDLLIKKLGELVNIRYAEGEDGDVTITAGNTGVIVSGGTHRELFVTRTEGKSGKREGNVEIFYKPTEQSNPVNLTRQLTGGKVGGLLSVRDETINRLIDDVNTMAYRLGSEVNKIHQAGYDRYDRKGVAFFEFAQGANDAAALMKVSDQILEDVGKVVAADQPSAPGNNRIANILSSLQFQQTMRDGTANFDEYYATLVGQIGVETGRANSAHESQKDIVKQLKNLRESISGVSLDEETTKMIEYQKTFDASARLVRTADEMMDTVLNLKR